MLRMNFNDNITSHGVWEMPFTKVGKTCEIPVGTVKVYNLGVRTIVICNVDGQFHAIDYLCTHDEESLEQGDLCGYEIECPRHLARFDVRSGEVTALPAEQPIETFQVRVQGDDIEIEL